METDIDKLHAILKRAYLKLAECQDSHAGGEDSWKSEEQRQIIDEIADALDIEEKDRE